MKYVFAMMISSLLVTWAGSAEARRGDWKDSNGDRHPKGCEHDVRNYKPLAGPKHPDLNENSLIEKKLGEPERPKDIPSIWRWHRAGWVGDPKNGGIYKKGYWGP